MYAKNSVNAPKNRKENTVLLKNIDVLYTHIGMPLL